MAIKETKKKKKVQMPDGKEQQVDEDKVKPILNITLPAPDSGDLNAPLPIGKHNSCAEKNFRAVGNLLTSLNRNQRVIVSLIDQQEKEIKKLKENMKKISDNISKLLKENKNDGQTKRK